MDFLSLFALYVLCVLACMALVCRWSHGAQTPLERSVAFVSQRFSSCAPRWLQGLFYKFLHGLFHQRTRLFLYLHLLLECAVYAEFAYEVFGYCREMDTQLSSLIVPYVLLVVQSCCFYLCCYRDPGTVTTDNHASQVQVYLYDRRLFHPGVSCSTCLLVKPARSKHCRKSMSLGKRAIAYTLSPLLLTVPRVCNRCVERFDHHCVWVNNCIGAQNYRYFLLYLLLTCAMAVDIAVLTADMLFHVVLQADLLHARYIDHDGQQQPAGLRFIIQHLFLTFPRIVFMLGFLIFVFLLLAGYSLFHLYLAVVNQTSNEWYKGRARGCEHCQGIPGHQCSPPPVTASSFYNRGILRNLWEIFHPLTASVKKNK